MPQRRPRRRRPCPVPAAAPPARRPGSRRRPEQPVGHSWDEDAILVPDPRHDMEFDISVYSVFLLVGAGFLAGFINTIAGGGSMLTLPAFMMLGLPADLANGTNRVGVVLQSVAGVRGFHRAGRLAAGTIVPTLVPTLTGSLAGSVLASYLPVTWLEPTLLGTMVVMALLMLLRPAVVAPPPGTPPYALRDRPSAWMGLFAGGV